MRIFRPFFIVVFIVILSGLIMATQKNVPNVEFTALNGEKISLERLRGKPVIVTFWATDCASCLKEIPIWLELYSRFHAQGLEIIAVSMNYDPPNHVIELSKQRTLPYLITLDVDAKIASAFGNVKVTPTTFLLNPKGKIAWQKLGLFELAELQPQIENFLKEK